jgi:lipoprotein-releasing system permease protein
LKYPFEIFLGLRYLASKRKRAGISVMTWLSVAGVVIGVMAVNVVLSVMNGFSEDLKSRIVGLNPHIIISGNLNQPLADYDRVTRTIRSMEHVKFVGPFVEGQALARSRERSLGVMVWGVEPTQPQAIADLDKYLLREAKTLDLRPPAAPGAGLAERIFLGYELARRLQASVGDDLILFLPILQATPLGMTPRSVKFQVVGLLKTGMFDYDATYTYVSLPVGQKIYDLAENATGVAVKVDNVDKASLVAKAIREKFHGKYFVRDWLQMNHNLFVALQMERMVMGIILSLIVLVAVMSIVSTLILLVMEKTKEIGILKAMGSSRSSITFIFVFEGLVIGVIGIVIGLLLGFVMCSLIALIPIPMPGGGMVYYIDRLPVKVDALVCYCIVPLVSIFLCFLSTLYPALQAANLEPVEAIRYG